MGVFNTTPATLTTGQSGFLQLDSVQNLLVNLKTALPAGTNTIGVVNQGTAGASPWAENLTQVGGTAFALGQTTMAASLPVTIASNQSAIPVSTTITTATGALGALNANVVVAMAGQSSSGMQLSAGTLIGTIVPNVSFDGGVTWQATYWQNSATGALFGNFIFASANPAEGHSLIAAPGATHVRVVVTAYTSGTANVTLSATTVSAKSTLFDGISGDPPPPTVVQIGGLVATSAPSLTNGNMQTLSMTLAGALRVDGSGVTQPISATALPLPTGAATAANQATEITSLQTIDNMIGSVGAGTAGTGSALIGGIFNTTQPTLTNGQQVGAQMTAVAP